MPHSLPSLQDLRGSPVRGQLLRCCLGAPFCGLVRDKLGEWDHGGLPPSLSQGHPGWGSSSLT